MITEILILSFFTGLIVKLVDAIEDDDLKLFKFDNIIFGTIYGLIIAFMVIK